MKHRNRQIVVWAQESAKKVLSAFMAAFLFNSRNLLAFQAAKLSRSCNTFSLNKNRLELSHMFTVILNHAYTLLNDLPVQRKVIFELRV